MVPRWRSRRYCAGVRRAVRLALRPLSRRVWVQGGGVFAGMEFATVLWLRFVSPCSGSSVWYVKARSLQMATCWAWLIRMNAAGIVVGLLMK